MSIKCKVVSKINPQNRTESKFYMQPIRKGTISRAKIEERIVRETSLSKADVRSALTILSDMIGDYLTEGYNVALNEIGTLSIRVKSEGVENEADATVNNISAVSVGFRPAVELKEKMTQTKFEKE
ncbi:MULTISPECIES: HU family DNA-binding protein [Carboxylicivirga]|uniref:HU family DNA-binding protein n=1 Tax=Carboxylicivirga TaxID=1628153 RepID=UPI001FD29A34|nr:MULTISPECIES: HU family DNA-binding protein [Carboxylicivirga]